MILTCEQMRLSEERLFASGVEVEPLMDRAGKGVADVVSQFCPLPGHAHVFVGKGHNGGDALVAAGHLRERGWMVGLHLVEEDPGQLSALTAKKLAQFREREQEISPPLSHGFEGQIVIDGLLGIGAVGPLRGVYTAQACEINRIRSEMHALTFAIDIPTGLDGDSGVPVENAVVADVTVTMAQVKTGLIADSAINHVGRLAVVPLDEISPIDGDSLAEVLVPRFLGEKLAQRKYDSHKTMVGRVGVIAGSRGFTGAAQLCAEGALRAGAGLVTLFAEESIYAVLASAAIPEVMVKPVADYRAVAGENLDVIAIGPGLGQARSAEVVDLVREDSRPMVVDADALNSLAAAGVEDVLKDSAGPRLLTPHPGEMARLWPKIRGDRRRTAEETTSRVPGVTLLLKGARTVIAAADRPTAFNTTGHPGMASGGMGDVLTGVCAGLMGQGISGYDAACLGAWLSGRGAELAICEGGGSVESVSAVDVLLSLGSAFQELRRGCY